MEIEHSGLKIVYDLSKPVYQRVESVETLCTDCVIPQYEKIDLNRNYSVVLPRFLWKGNFGFEMLRTQGLNPTNLRSKFLICVRVATSSITSSRLHIRDQSWKASRKPRAKSQRLKNLGCIKLKAES